MTVAPTFTPRVPDETHPYGREVHHASLAMRAHTVPWQPAGGFPRRASKALEHPGRPPLDAATVALLSRVRDGLRALPGDLDVIYAQLMAEGTGPRPVLTVAEPDEEPVPEDWREWLAAMAYGAARWAEPPVPTGCCDCKGSLTGYCDTCADSIESAGALDRLHDEILTAPDMATALRLMAGSAAWRTASDSRPGITPGNQNGQPGSAAGRADAPPSAP